MRALPLLVLLATACATAAPERHGPAPADAAARMVQAPVAAAQEGGYETGRLAAGQAVAGPFVLTYLGAGAELTVFSSAGAPLGNVTGPLAQPFHLAAGLQLRATAGGEVVYAGYRAMPLTRPLETYLGRQILVALPGAQAEAWWLRELGGDHLTLERSRTYRVLPLRRVVEITWTDLTGIDPTPKVVLTPE